MIPRTPAFCILLPVLVLGFFQSHAANSTQNADSFPIVPAITSSSFDNDIFQALVANSADNSDSSPIVPTITASSFNKEKMFYRHILRFPSPVWLFMRKPSKVDDQMSLFRRRIEEVVIISYLQLAACAPDLHKPNCEVEVLEREVVSKGFAARASERFFFKGNMFPALAVQMVFGENNVDLSSICKSLDEVEVKARQLRFPDRKANNK